MAGIIRNKTVIVVAGGTGTRMGGAVPKQFLDLGGKPLIFHTIEVFYSWDPEVELIICLPASLFDDWKKLCKKHSFFARHVVVEGGTTRFNTVSNALQRANKDSLVAIHDAVRPFVSNKTIEQCFVVAEKSGTAVPCIEIPDSVRAVEGGKNYPINRSSLRMIQTPQVFRGEIIKKAYRQSYLTEFTDDASVVEKSGFTINLVEGNRENMKITTPEDLDLARAYYTILSK